MSLPYKISVLVFIQDSRDRYLLIQRTKKPNQGLWSPIGGKLEMATGESPFECAVREVREEVDLHISTEDLHLFSMIAEKSYEGAGHWLMFLFRCRVRLDDLPQAIDEGTFGFFSREEVDALPLPQTDRQGLWAVLDRHGEGFVALRADCDPGKDLQIITEQVL